MPVREADDTLLRSARMGGVNHADGAWADARPVGSHGPRATR